MQNRQQFCIYFFKLICVVYFDQRTHACACVCMVENNKNYFKIENVQGDLGTTDLTNLSWQKLGH